jgi:hypothetical protein
MVLIPGGDFLMSSPEGEGFDGEHPQHRVRVNSNFILFILTIRHVAEPSPRREAGDARGDGGHQRIEEHE